MVKIDLDSYIPYPVPCRCGKHVFRPDVGWCNANWDAPSVKTNGKLPCLMWSPEVELEAKAAALVDAENITLTLESRVMVLRRRLGLPVYRPEDRIDW